MRRIATLIAGVLLLSGCFENSPQQSVAPATVDTKQVPAKVAANTLAPSTVQVERGRRIYNFRCYYCHGYSGDARTLAASWINPKPLDFTSASPDVFSRDRMRHSVQFGRPGTAMMSFSSVLNTDEIAAVVDFVRQEFMIEKRKNTRYHTEENGWHDHQRYAAAFPFTSGEIPLDTPWEQLTPEQVVGKKLFMSTCVSCHDRARVNNPEIVWEERPVSYPRNQYSPGDNVEPNANSRPATAAHSLDAMASASPYLIHERVPAIANLSEAEQRGEDLFQHNCAFCHAADGTARNWIGSFMEPHPRDLTHSAAMDSMTKTRLHSVIRDGLPDTSMPAWKSVLSEQQVQDIVAYVSRAFHPLPP
ncbi:MAG: c-type cytochrome [Gallionella sp.]